MNQNFEKKKKNKEELILFFYFSNFLLIKVDQCITKRSKRDCIIYHSFPILSTLQSSKCRPSFITYTIYILQSSKYTASSDENSGYSRTRTVADRMVHIVSWIDCLDLRVLAVLMNSTLSCARFVEYHWHQSNLVYLSLQVFFGVLKCIVLVNVDLSIIIR